MPLRPRRSPSLLAALAAATLAVGVLSPPAGAAAQRAASTPVVGDCHRMTNAEFSALSDPDKPVGCSGEHHSKTVVVVEVPPEVALDDVAALQEVATEKCSPTVVEEIGGSRRQRLLTAYSYAFFVPTQEQVDEGARWMRCDLKLISTGGVVPLPHSKAPRLGAGAPKKSESRCYTLKRGDHYPVSCANRHEYRATDTFKVRTKTYPSTAKRQRLAARACPRITRSDKWLATFPSETAFEAGQKLAICSEQNHR